MPANKKIPKKVGLALSGGSTLGIAHVGVLKALADNGISIDCISGTSAGALVAACYAFGLPISEISDLAKGMNWKKISSFAYSRLGLHSNKPMSNFITDLLGDVKIEDAGIPLAVIATDIETYEMVTLRSGSLHEAVRASTCIPGLFSPVELDGKLLVDGGLSENLPLTSLAEMGATIKIGVNLVANPPSLKPKNVFDVLNNSFTVLSRHRDSSLSSRADVIIEPDLSAFNASKFKDAELMMKEGYDATIRVMPLIRGKITSLKIGKKDGEQEGLMSRLRGFFKR